MYNQDTSVKEHKCGAVICDVCRQCETSPLNYGSLSFYPFNGKDGYMCLICQGKMERNTNNS